MITTSTAPVTTVRHDEHVTFTTVTGRAVFDLPNLEERARDLIDTMRERGVTVDLSDVAGTVVP